MAKRALSIRRMLLLGIWSDSAYAQVTTATLYGNVSDPSDAAVAGASVTLSHPLTGATWSTLTNEQGEFTLTFLPVGEYTVSIEARGFKAQRQAGIILTAGQRLRLTYKLEVGALSESVTVSGEAPILNAVTVEQRENLATTQVRELPLARRDWTNLLNLGTGVLQAGTGGVALNGLPPAGFTLTVDGTDASGDPELPSLSLYLNWNLIKGISTEAISEVNVAKGIASAEIANSFSGNVNVISKSGTNQFHGSLFENNQTENVSARDQFLSIKPPLVFNQFGGSLGGPVIRNKLFFFGVYEGYRLRAFRSVNGNVPTKEFREQVTAAVPAFRQFLDLLPPPNQPHAPGAVTGFFQGAGSNLAADNHSVARVDYHFSSANLFTARYIRSRPTQQIPRISANPQTFTGIVEAGTLNFTHTRSSLSAETRFGYNRDDTTRADRILEMGIPAIICCLGFGGENGNAKILSKGGSTKSLEEVVALTRGRHSFKFGGIFQRRVAGREGPGNADFSFASVADMLANTPSALTVTFGDKEFRIRNFQIGYFIQDDFKLRRNLIVNLGTRYDYFSVPVERDGRYFNRDGPFGPLRPPDSAYNADRNNFSPRAGFAWTVDRSAKTVVRGGFGMFVNPHTLFGGPVELVQNAIDEPFRSNFSRAEAQQFGLKYPVNKPDVLRLVKNPNAPNGSSTINPDFPDPYSLQWTLSIQRQITSTLALETAYVGNRGVKINLGRDYNQVDRLTGRRPNPRFLQFRYYDTSDSSHYNAWQTSLRKRFAHNFSFNTHYTWSNNIAYSDDDLLNGGGPQEIDNVRNDKSPTPFDARHRFVSDFIYELPFGRMVHAATRPGKLIAEGWQFAGILTAQSGQALYIEQGSSLRGSRPDYIGGTPLNPDARQTLRYLNAAAFARVPVIQASGAAARPGTLGRGAVRGPGYWNMDLALSKNLAFTERVRFQIRGDLFNALNHTNFSGVSTNVVAGNFGRYVSTRGARVVQLNARLVF